MHELAVCQALIRQVEAVAARHGAVAVERIVVAAGALSGVEPDLLSGAFAIARVGTAAAGAQLDIERQPVVVLCRCCGVRSVVPSNRLLCGECAAWQVEVVQGEDLVLLTVDLRVDERRSAGFQPAPDELSEEVRKHV